MQLELDMTRNRIADLHGEADDCMYDGGIWTWISSGIVLIQEAGFLQYHICAYLSF